MSKVKQKSQSPYGERILWILEQKGWSARRLSREANLPSSTHVNLLVAYGHEPTIETLRAIAKAGGVRFAWLASGEGTPYAASAGGLEDKRIELQRAISAFETLHNDEPHFAQLAIHTLLTESQGEADQPRSEWLAELEATFKRVRRRKARS